MTTRSIKTDTLSSEITSFRGLDIETLIRLSDAPIDTEIHFKFIGKNETGEVINIRTSPLCGCTSATPNLIVGVGESFEIVGSLSPRPMPTTYSKGIKVSWTAPSHPTEDPDHSLTISFTGKAIKS